MGGSLGDQREQEVVVPGKGREGGQRPRFCPLVAFARQDGRGQRVRLELRTVPCFEDRAAAAPFGRGLEGLSGRENPAIMEGRSGELDAERKAIDRSNWRQRRWAAT